MTSSRQNRQNALRRRLARKETAMSPDHFQRTVLQALHGLRSDISEIKHVQSIILRQSTARCNGLADLMQAVDARNRKLDDLSASLQRAFDDQSDSWWREGRDPFGGQN